MQTPPPLAGERILVTGGAGFIGSTFARRVVEHNEVVLLDNFHRDALRHHAGLAEHPNVTVQQGSVLDPADVDRAIDGCSMVVHCAAIAGVGNVLSEPTRTMRVNIIGTWQVLEAAVRAGGIKRFVDFSTSEVFGSHAWKVSESDDTTVGPVGEPRWTYAVSKLATEHMTHCWHLEHGLPTVSLRPFNIYGPRQIGEGAVHHFVRGALAGEGLIVRGDGTQIRSWCFIDDFIEALLRALVLDSAVGESFNVGNPLATITVYQLAQEIVRLAGSSSDVSRVPLDRAEVEYRIPRVDKARDRLGFEARVGLREGLERTIAWYREAAQ